MKLQYDGGGIRQRREGNKNNNGATTELKKTNRYVFLLLPDAYLTILLVRNIVGFISLLLKVEKLSGSTIKPGLYKLQANVNQALLFNSNIFIHTTLLKMFLVTVNWTGVNIH